MDRKLVAILAADVVGYSALMERDENGTYARLKAHHIELFEPKIKKHHGRVFKLMGDGLLAEFASVVDAVECAVVVQLEMATRNSGVMQEERIDLRIGVNLGDVIIDGKDRHGDGVNIAHRLQSLAEPGGIVISGTVYDHVRNKLDAGLEFLGEQRVKNIVEPVRVYAVGSTPAVAKTAPMAAIAKPSVAVLPFTNIGGDPEQEYFSDGITEDIITDLSKVSALFVAARNTAFTLKGKAVDIVQAARKLNVEFLVEGAVRRVGNRIRITAQLIDGKTGGHVWAERYDRDFGDIFALQDDIARNVVTALRVRLLPEELRTITTRSTTNPDAYQLYLLGRHYAQQHSTRSSEIALRFGQRALKIDPNYARAWALVALCQASLNHAGSLEESGLFAAETALSLDPTLAEAHAVKGGVLCRLGRSDEAIAAHEESVRLEPDSFDTRQYFGFTLFFLGRDEGAIQNFERVAQLVESDYVSLSFAAQSYEKLGRHQEANAAARRALERIEKQIALRPDHAHAVGHGAALLAYLGEKERAKEWASRVLIMESEDPKSHYNVACALARLKDPAQALDLLESCIPKMSPEFINWVQQDTDLIALHSHPRFKALIERGKARQLAGQAGKPC
ncbi:adenylate/guanylate cyclase domain-containing protein [Mesorhizobium sp. M0800]|uniref:adenylate/guanylate cyclase domain-containing protein n=1 Tax=Mesorhizobium sp. M0800 TaxID=2957000 RepID=UPI00333A4FFE